MTSNVNSGPKPSKVEGIKSASEHLRGNIVQELADETPRFEEESVQLLKFHGVYQQEDRDHRAQVRGQKDAEKKYQMMIRTRIPGGVMDADAYLGMDQVARTYANRTLRITTRQTFQFHGVLKGELKPTIAEINETMLTTLGGCGDQVRNVMTCPAPYTDGIHEQAQQYTQGIVALLGAKTNAYFELFLDGEKIAYAPEEEPIYGDRYLPRKFKIGMAIEGDNCVDVYTQDLGLVAHVDGRSLTGFTVLAGGGLGATHNKPDTYPRIATPIGWVPAEKLLAVSKAVLEVQRDYGDRGDRRHARLKYTIDRNGIDWFIAEVEKYMGEKLAPPRDLKWDPADDHYGWQQQGDGRWFLGLWVQNGRIMDSRERKLMSALRRIVTRYRPSIRLTALQNVLLCDIDEADKPAIDSILARAGVPLPDTYTRTMRQAMACPATPTCGLAVAEAERSLPSLLRELDEEIIRLGLQEAPISIRMTGCPNGCARPYISDIGFVGRTAGKYNVHIGGSFQGTRLNTLWKETVPIEEITGLFRPLFEDYAANRCDDEAFGDFCIRTGVIEPFATPPDYQKKLAASGTAVASLVPLEAVTVEATAAAPVPQERRETPNERLRREARDLFPGGVNSPVRSFRSVDGRAIPLVRGKGATVTDADGNDYLDYVAAFGPHLLGHAHPDVVQAIAETAANGTAFGALTPGEVELGTLVKKATGVDQWRFVNSGTEATMSAIRVARGATRRQYVVKFDGCYHGHSDGLLAKAGSGLATLGISGSAGVPDQIAGLTAVLPYNDHRALARWFAEHGADTAAVIVEPVAGNMGVVEPSRSFAEALQVIPHEYGSLLIADEIITGFRLRHGLSNVLPRADLYTLGKIIGGGMPIGAFGGSDYLMGHLAPKGNVYQAGTLSGNPIVMAAGAATLRALANENAQERAAELAARLDEQLFRAILRSGVEASVARVGSMLTLFFRPDVPRNNAEAGESDTALFSRFHRGMLDAGIMIPPSQFEAWFVSSVHTEDEIDRTAEAAATVLMRLAGRG